MLACLHRSWNNRGMLIRRKVAASLYVQSPKHQVSIESQACANIQIDDDFVSTLRQRMVDGRAAFLRGEKRLYVQHQHKCGGSTLCRFFRGSGLRVPTVRNCNGDSWMWPLVHGTREDLQILYRNTSLDVLFNEREFFSQDVPEDEFVFITSARDPVPRMISSMLQSWQDLPVDDYGIVRNLSHTLADFLLHGINENTPLEAPANLQTLNLAGERWEEHGKDWQKLQRLAIDRLRLFTFTIPTENLSEGLTYMRAFFGLKIVMPKNQERWNTRGASKQLDFLQQHDPGLLKKIRKDNFYGYCLHLQALKLWEIQKKIVEKEVGSVAL